MQMPADEASVISASEYLAILRKYRRWLLIVPLAIALTVGALTWVIGPEYGASVTLLVNPASSPGVEYPNDVVAANMLTRTYGKLATSPLILQQVIADLGLPENREQLEDKVTAKPEPDTQIITITARYRDRQRAVDIANAVATAFVAWANDLQSGRSTQTSEAVQQSVDKARADIDATTAEVTALRGQPGARTTDEFNRIASLEALLDQQQKSLASLLEIQQQLELTQLAARNRVAVVGPAELPNRASSPPGLVYALAAAAGTFFVMAAGIVLVERSRNRVQTSGSVRREVNLPVLGTIPRSPDNSVFEPIALPQSETSEAIRALRTTLGFAANGQGLGIVAFASPENNDAKSAIVAKLAVALAQGGQRVVLIDGNLRRPRQHGLFGMPNARGFADLLADPTEPVENLLIYSSHPGLQVLVAGTATTGLANGLTQGQLARAVASVRAHSDIVVIDAPALSAPADALPVAAAADHAVILAEAGRTRMDRLGVAVTSLRATGVDVLGIVLHGSDEGAVLT